MERTIEQKIQHLKAALHVDTDTALVAKLQESVRNARRANDTETAQSLGQILEHLAPGSSAATAPPLNPRIAEWFERQIIVAHANNQPYCVAVLKRGLVEVVGDGLTFAPPVAAAAENPPDEGETVRGVDFGGGDRDPIGVDATTAALSLCESAGVAVGSVAEWKGDGSKITKPDVEAYVATLEPKEPQPVI